MGLVAGKCPDCGADLKIDDSAKGELTCPHCGGKYLVEKAKIIINGGIINDNFNKARGDINQNAESPDIIKLFENARMALKNDDWKKVEKSYGTIERYESSNIEAVFFSAYGRVMSSLFSKDFFARQQKIKVLLNSIAEIGDYYETTTENKEEVLRKIGYYIDKFDATEFVYDNSDGIHAVGGSSWCKKIMRPVRQAYISELKRIAKKHDEQYLIDIISDNARKIKGGCYIATCVYGSYDCPEVWTLRRFRDDTLGSTWYGRTFIRVYYAISPTLVKWFGKTKWFKKIWKGKLDKMVVKLQAEGVENTPYDDKPW